MKKGDLFYTKNYQDHMAYFLMDTHFLAYSSEKRTQFNYEKDLIRINMHKEKKVKELIKKYSK